MRRILHPDRSHPPDFRLAPIPTPRRPRYASLDAWRGLACLMVVLEHSSEYLRYYALTAIPTEGTFARIVGTLLHLGWIGVLMFFVISGYCISAAADSARRRPKAASHFFKSRARRIFPPYWIALLLTVGLVTVVSFIAGPELFTDHSVHPIPQPSSLTTSEWLGNFTLTEEWRARVLGLEKRQSFQLDVAWTLCYEVQFYALCGLVLLIAPRRLFAGLAVVSLFTLCAMIMKWSIRGLFFDGNWFYFAFGVLVYFYVNYASRPQKIGIVLACGLLVTTCLALRPIRSWQSELCVLGPCFPLILVILHPYDAQLVRAKWLRPIAFCGTMCYSLYLVHWPVVKLITHALFLAGIQSVYSTLLITLPAATGAAILLAWGFHIVVERHFINTSSQHARSPKVEVVPQVN